MKSERIMDARASHVTVCICTYRRPLLLQRLLEALARQKITAGFTHSIVVADNDADRSAERVVNAFAESADVSVVYCVESRNNIALARNKALEHASGKYVALLDDDEFPVDEWLEKMVGTCEEYHSAGVLGPVRPHYEQEPPAWVVRGGFCERPEHPTGRPMKWNESRTGNLLFRRSILEGIAEPFDARFGTGGEDVDFFLRMNDAGHGFVWCNEAPAYESVPAARLTRSFMLRRALLRGKNNCKLSTTRWKSVFRSLVALPLYLAFLPAAMILGHHQFMKYSIKSCDHMGKILALLGLNPIRQRESF